jgi:hypothetical protein
MEDRKTVALKFLSDCKVHNEKIVTVCIDDKCAFNGPLCYRCVYEKHADHPKKCIPLNYIEKETAQKEDNINYSNLQNKLDSLSESFKTFVIEEVKKIEDYKEREETFQDLLLNEEIKDVWPQLPKVGDKYILNQRFKNKIYSKFEKSMIKLSKIFLENEIRKLFLTDFKTEKKYMRFKNCLSDWNTNKSSIDSISFSVNKEGVFLIGLGYFKFQNLKTFGRSVIYLFENNLENQKLRIDSDEFFNKIKWEGNLGCVNFNTPIELTNKSKYILLEQNIEKNGPRFYGNGDVKNETFTFFDSDPAILKFNGGNNNGTCIREGQFPMILYYEM